MIDIKQIIIDVTSGLYEATGTPSVKVESPDSKPPYPFYAYNVNIPYQPQPGYAIQTNKDIIKDEENYIETLHQEQATITLSITAYSKDVDDANEKAINAKEWFNYTGIDYLYSKGIIVQEVMHIENRDTTIVTEYERRRGFDVILAVPSESKTTVETIEKVEINE